VKNWVSKFAFSNGATRAAHYTPGVERLTFSVEWEMTPEGEILSEVGLYKLTAVNP
jgi:hypothetical protein